MSPYLRLFRCELKSRERTGGFALAGEFLEECFDLLTAPEQRLVVQLEQARFQLTRGEWERCLNSLDFVGAQEELLSSADRALYYLVSARLHQGYGDLNQATAFLETALSEAEEADGPILTEALIELGGLFHRLGERERGAEFLDRAETMLSLTPDADLSVSLWVQRGLAAFRSGRPGDAEECYRKAFGLLPSPERPSVARGEILRYLGVLAATDGRPDEALASLQEALEDFRSSNHPLGRAKAYNSLGQTCLRMGRHAEARFFLEKAEALCRELGAEAERASILGKLGRVYSEIGQFEKAIDFQKQDLDLTSRFGNYRALAYALRNLGLSLRAEGRFEQAAGYLEDSRNRFRELGDQLPQARADLDLATTLAELEQWDRAQGYLDDALAILEKRLEATAELPWAHLLAGTLAVQRGDRPQAETSLWQALELSETFPNPARQANIHLELAKVYGATSDPEAALENLLSAYRLARRHNLPVLFNIVERLHELSPQSLFEMLETGS